MNNQDFDPDSIDRWLLDVSEGRAAPELTARINARLLVDPDLRAAVVGKLLDQTLITDALQLAEAETMFSSRSILPQQVRHGSPPADISVREPKAVEWRSSFRARPAFLIGIASLAATLLAIALIVPEVLQRRAAITGKAPVPNAAEASGAFDTEGVAILTQAVNVDWDPASPAARVNDRIAAGRLKIKSGLLQLEFFSGATVVLEGPADLELVSAMRCRCRFGKLRADVPPQAIGFTISDGDLDVVDLGTVFAMKVEEGGASEVHVLDGEVSIRRAGSDSERLLKNGNALRHVGDGDLSELTADPESFVDIAQLREMDKTSRAAAYRRWLSHCERWAADPDILLYYDFENQTGIDRRLFSAIADAPSSSEGAIVGCRWTEGRFDGKRALEFKRTSDRVRVNLEGEFDSLSLVVWLRLEGFDHLYNSLLLADAYAPAGRVHWQVTSEGIVKLSVSGDGSYPSPQVFTPNDLGRWVQLVTVYDRGAGEVRHFVDGALVSASAIQLPMPLSFGNAEIGNWNPLKNGRNAIRSLNGLVDEIAVFRRTLSHDEIMQSYSAGNPNQ